MCLAGPWVIKVASQSVLWGQNTLHYEAKKIQVYRHNVVTTWNRLLSDDNTAADAAAGCERPQLCYNDGGIYTV